MTINEKKIQELLIDDIIIKLSGQTAPRGDDEICISVLEAKQFLMKNLDVFKFISLQSSSSEEGERPTANCEHINHCSYCPKCGPREIQDKPTSVDTAPVDLISGLKKHLEANLCDGEEIVKGRSRIDMGFVWEEIEEYLTSKANTSEGEVEKKNNMIKCISCGIKLYHRGQDRIPYRCPECKKIVDKNILNTY